jgi:hypothetical protein
LRHGIIPFLVAVFLDCDFGLISRMTGTEKVSNRARTEKLVNLTAEALDKSFRRARFVVAWAQSEMITRGRPRLEGDQITRQAIDAMRWDEFYTARSATTTNENGPVSDGMQCMLPSYRRARGTDKKETGNEEG